MKILEANAGALTNFEVLDFLKSRGASKDSTRVLSSISQSEYLVHDYLVTSPACNQTRESINEFMEKCKKFNLAKAEVLNIINVRPSSLVEIDPIIEQFDNRLGEELQEELVELIEEVLPPPPTTSSPPEEESPQEETVNEQNGKNEATNEDQVETT